jgi:soluble lytic murein transglycosylase
MSPALGFTLTCIKRVASVALAATLAAVAPECAAQAAASDAEFLAARDAAQRGNLKALESARKRFAGHLLEAYPSYWLLTATLDKVDPAQVQEFLARYSDSPLAESLRRDWLKSLGTAGQWDPFRREFQSFALEDAEVACYSLQERLARQDPEALAETRALWIAGRESPAVCTLAFEAAAGAGRIGPPEAWERIRKLLAAGLLRDARRANEFLPNKEQFNEKALERANADPLKYLATEKSRIPTRATHELLLFAVARLARARPEDAAAQLRAHAAVLGPDDTRQGWAQIGHAAALLHHPQALAWYAEAGEGPFTDEQLAWKARAGLRAQDWDAVRAAVNLMSAEKAREPAWRYWLARALAQRNAKDAAEALLRPLSGERNFYGLLAAEDLGLPQAPDWSPKPPSAEDLARVKSLPGLQRAFALYRLDMNAEAFREWLVALRGFDDRSLLAAAEAAREAGLADRAIGAADRTSAIHDFTQRFPVPHHEPLAAAARQWSVDEALVLGIIRQESRFNAEARSRVGATGLMQLMPATARWVAKQIPLHAYRPALLTQPETNLQMGTYYFRRVLTDLGDPVLATAAYNAGPGRARRWRDAKPLEGAIYAETIPFNETRDYVKKVMSNTWFYTSRLTGRTPSLRALLGTVPGRAAGEVASAAAIP